MSEALVGFFVLGILIVIILIYLLSVNKNPTNSNNNLIKIDLYTIQLPKNIEQMNTDALLKATKVILDSYKSLDYVNKLPSNLDKIEWHTWQVSIILHFLKSENKLLIINDNDKIFHNVLLELHETKIDQEMQRIFKKYLENVNIYKNRDDLSKDIIWTARDVSIIFYKILNIK